MLISSTALARLLPRSRRDRFPRRQRRPRAFRRVESRARRAPLYRGALEGAVPCAGQQDRRPRRSERGRAKTPLRTVSDDWEGASSVLPLQGWGWGFGRVLMISE